MRLKKLIVAGAVMLGLASVGAVSNNAHASSYFGTYLTRATYARRSYVRRPMKLEKLNHSSVFAYVKQIGSKWVHKNERVGVVPFYHMGHDGYIVHIPGYRGIYYAPTNSHSWFGKKVVKRHHESKWARKVDTAWDRAPKHVKSHFRYTNNKRLLRKSGFKYEVPADGKYPCVISNYPPNSRKAYIKRGVKFSAHKPYQTGWQSGLIVYGYQGHNNWKL